MASKNVKRALAVYESFNKRDLDQAVAHVADDVTWIDHGRGITSKSRDEFKATLAGWIEGFSDGQGTDFTAHDAGNTVIVQFTGRGTNDGAMGPAPATGRRASVPMVDIVTFDSKGKIIRGESYFDMLGMLVQLGLAEAPTM